MLVISCAHCHKYYDSHSFEVCPYCGGAKVEQPAVDTAAQQQSKKRGWPFGKKNNDKQANPQPRGGGVPLSGEQFAVPPANVGPSSTPVTTAPPSMPPAGGDATVGIFGVTNDNPGNAASGGYSGDSATVGIFSDATSQPAVNVGSHQPAPNGGSHVDFARSANESTYQQAAYSSSNAPLWATPNNDDSPVFPAANTEPLTGGYTPTASVPQQQPFNVPDQNIATEPEQKSVSIEEEVRKATASSDGKTVGYFSIGTPSASNEEDTDDSKPAAPAAKVVPVVGWLVCVKGSHFGEHFALESGRNSIGRNSTNSVVLSRELSVSREKHAWLIYEPKKREFFISPGESSGLTYCNGDNIFQPQKLSALDVIELGESSYVFMPLCGEQFTWDDYIQKSDK